MNRLLVTLAVLGLAVAALVLALRGRGERGGAQPAAELARAAADTAPIVPVLAATEEAAEPARDVVPPDPAVSPEAVLDAEPMDEGEQGLVVLVVDPDGAPVPGVPVALLGRIDTVEDSEQTYTTATTDVHGRARLVEESDALTKRERAMEFMEVTFSFRVEAQVLFPERPSHDLGAAPESSESVVLVLPPAGRLRVHVATPDGAPLPAWCQVFPTWRSAGSEGRFERLGTPRVTVVDGVADFPALPLGQEFQLSVTGGKRYRSGVAVATGPARAGEVVDVDVRLGPPLAEVTGVLVGTDGAPLTDVSVAMALFVLERDAAADAEPERVPWLWTQLDGAGRFARWTDLKPAATERLALLVHEEARHTKSDVDRFARWDGGAELAPGATLDVGTLVLRPDERRRLLVDGRVLAEDGAPLRNIAVSASVWDAETRRWIYLTEDRVEVDGDGRFEAYTIAGELPERFTVSAGARGCLGASLEAAPGERGLELILRRGGGLAGRFVADDPAALPLLAVLLEGEDFRREPDIGMGNFRVDNLPPGRYAVTAKGHGTDWRFGGIEDVVVPVGGFADDPRLERIDLGDACRVLRLTVLDPDGAPIPKHYIDIEDPAGDGGNFRTNEAGELVALVPAAAEVLGVSVSYQGKRLGRRWSASSGYAGTLTLTER